MARVSCAVAISNDDACMAPVTGCPVSVVGIGAPKLQVLASFCDLYGAAGVEHPAIPRLDALSMFPRQTLGPF